MVLEWLRRRDPALDTMLRRYLFIDKPVLEREADADADTDAGESGSVERGGDGSLGMATCARRCSDERFPARARAGFGRGVGADRRRSENVR